MNGNNKDQIVTGTTPSGQTFAGGYGDVTKLDLVRAAGFTGYGLAPNPKNVALVPREGRARESRPRVRRASSSTTARSNSPPRQEDEPPGRPLAFDERRGLHHLIDLAVRAKVNEYDRVWRRCRRCGLDQERVDFGRASYCRRCEVARVTSSRRLQVAA